MPKYPVLKPSEIIRILNILGFVEVRQKGSHKQFKNNKGKSTTIPVHKGKDVSPLLLRRILKEIDIELETFLRYL